MIPIATKNAGRQVSLESSTASHEFESWAFAHLDSRIPSLLDDSPVTSLSWQMATKMPSRRHRGRGTNKWELGARGTAEA